MTILIAFWGSSQVLSKHGWMNSCCCGTCNGTVWPGRHAFVFLFTIVVLSPLPSLSQVLAILWPCMAMVFVFVCLFLSLVWALSFSFFFFFSYPPSHIPSSISHCHLGKVSLSLFLCLFFSPKILMLSHKVEWKRWGGPCRADKMTSYLFPGDR